jgi:hypothetical protein
MIRIGIDSIDVDSAALALGRALKVEFRPHESDFYGGAYRRAEVNEGLIIIRRNTDVIDDGPIETNWPADKLVLYLDGLSDVDWQPYVHALSIVHFPKTQMLAADLKP